MALTKVRALKDNDGHWYIVPEDIASQFYSMLRDCEESDDYEMFDDTFGQYMTGGDINRTQLWAEI